MAIDTSLTYEQALALPDPKHIWLNGAQVVVYTGADIPADESPRTISVHEFRLRFTESEMDAIAALAYGGDVNVRRLLLKLQTNKDGIELDAPEVIAGLDYLVTKLAITAERKTEILT